MTGTSDSHRGYAYAPAVRQYSAGVAAQDGHALHRRTMSPRPLAEAVPVILAHLRDVGVASDALCAIELRSAAPRSETGFAEFNAEYFGELERLQLLVERDNPIGRTNVCDVGNDLEETVVHAFSYCAPDSAGTPTFVISGSAEVAEGLDQYAANAARRGETSPDALREKAQWVLREMERRMALFGVGWGNCTAVQVYTAHLDDQLRSMIVATVGRPDIIDFHDALPPVSGLEFEMDCRGVASDADLEDAR